MDQSRDAVNGAVGLEWIVTARWRRSSSVRPIGEWRRWRWCALARVCYVVATYSQPSSSVFTLGFTTSPLVAGLRTRGMPSVKPLRTTSTQSEVESDVAVSTVRPWNVVVWNDPVTPMKVVEIVFKRIFGYSNNKCTQYDASRTPRRTGDCVVGGSESARSPTASNSK